MVILNRRCEAAETVAPPTLSRTLTWSTSRLTFLNDCHNQTVQQFIATVLRSSRDCYQSRQWLPYAKLPSSLTSGTPLCWDAIGSLAVLAVRYVTVTRSDGPFCLGRSLHPRGPEAAPTLGAAMRPRRQPHDTPSSGTTVDRSP